MSENQNNNFGLVDLAENDFELVNDQLDEFETELQNNPFHVDLQSRLHLIPQNARPPFFYEAIRTVLQHWEAGYQIDNGDVDPIKPDNAVRAATKDHVTESVSFLDDENDVKPKSNTGITDFTLIDEFEILECIGEGSVGKVFLAHDHVLDRKVAIKITHMPLSKSANGMDNLRREVRAASMLKHPNIVKVHKAGNYNGFPYLALEYVDGDDLNARLAIKGSFSPGEAVTLVATIARALDYAHREGIVHRDVKPSNILIDKNKSPQITDFGMARLTFDDSLTRSGTIMGTFAYMSPEQVRGEGNKSTPQTDVWALGVLLFHLWTGRTPFGTGAACQQGILKDEPKLSRDEKRKIPRDLRSICFKSLNKSPADRYESAAALADDLERFQKSEPTVARPLSVLGRTGRWCKRNQWPTALAAIVLSVAKFFYCCPILESKAT